MNILQRGKNYRSTHSYQNYRIINGVSLGFGIVHRKEEFHERISGLPQYKTALPILEMKDPDNGVLRC